MIYRNIITFTECGNGTFGYDCTETCGKCMGEEPCNHVNGTCLDGCGRGYKGDLCLECNTFALYIITTRILKAIGDGFLKAVSSV